MYVLYVYVYVWHVRLIVTCTTPIWSIGAVVSNTLERKGSMSRGKNTPEYQKLSTNTANLRRAIKNNIDTGPLCDELMDAGLINDDQKRSLKNRTHDAGERASTLISLILGRVDERAQCFHKLVEVLENAGTTYRPVLEDLKLDVRPIGEVLKLL